MRTLDKICNFCQRKGHLKADCYALKAKSKQSGAAVQANGACLAVSMPSLSVVDVKNEMQESVLPGELDSFLPFVSDGLVSRE